MGKVREYYAREINFKIGMEGKNLASGEARGIGTLKAKEIIGESTPVSQTSPCEKGNISEADQGVLQTPMLKGGVRPGNSTK